MTTMTVPEVLEACADKWESGQWGWRKGGFEITDPTATENIAVCAVGGIRKVLLRTAYPIQYNGDACATYEQVSSYLRRRILNGSLIEFTGHDDVATVITWNDKICRSKTEAVEFFKQAAKDFRNTQGEGNGSQSH